MIEEIPNSWKFVSFGDVIDFITDYQANGSFATLKENVQYYNTPNYAVLVRLKDLRTSMKTYSQFIYTDERGYNFLKKSRVQEGDLLVANVGSVGVTLKMPNVSFKATLAPNMFRVDLNSNFSKQLFLYYTKSAKYWEELKKAAGGSTSQPKINKSQYRSILIPLPPLPEQQRIVYKIEELFSELDKGIETLKTAKQQLLVYRQAVLKYAFEGKLTNPSVKEGQLPEGWVEKSLNDFCKVETGTTPSKSNPEFYENGNIPFYKPTDLEANKNVYLAREYVTDLGRNKSRYVPEGSTLVTCIGATIGKTGFLTRGGVFNQQINAIIPEKNILPKYLYYQAIAPNFQEQIKLNASATTLPILNKGKFVQLKMFLCDEKEQNQIVQEIESRLSVCDKIEESIVQGLQQAEALRQSILKKAFEGKLVPQDPNDEPASVLLERIKAERQKAKPEKKIKIKKVKA